MLDGSDEDGLGVATLLRAPLAGGDTAHGAQALQADAGGIDVSGTAKDLWRVAAGVTVLGGPEP